MAQKPLAERLRPSGFENFLGQEHLTGENSVLRKMVENNTVHSMILWGPPGVGKTTLAYIISKKLNRSFFPLSAINSGVKDVREVIEKARARHFINTPAPLLFIDEIHRFSKSQQDSLLGAVEKGEIILIGATTENPSFEVITPLLSRCQVYILKALDEKALLELAGIAFKTDTELKKLKINIVENQALLRFSGGDARKLFNIIELIVNSTNQESITIDNKIVIEVLQQNIAIYDKNGEQHYDLISAFIKSIRGSDPNAAVYYLARMLEGGEDIKFIARRMIILAAEDIGLANPNSLLLATSCFDAVSVIGIPESRIILSQVAIYLATSPKSNSAYMAIEDALALVRDKGNLPIPLRLRNAPTQLMKKIGYGKEYKYAHSFDNNFADMEFLPDEIAGTRFYTPQKSAKETEILNYLTKCWKGKYGY